ncbi:MULTISPECIES: hypothetical protein [unclassified Leucobacter]|uniref:hypothetical protein n=1 Tax=unclassified Leucobacter TaxID=2621730 RepID=UPI00165D6B17|nr:MULTISPECIES: hypothetical protein [unclassified Leucobacter]MBC9927573.1 hypothetical protein [Leucobacter sp. cx-169]
MNTLKVVRNLVGFVWIGITVWGVVSLFQGQWIALIVSIILWILCSIVFGSLHGSLQRVEMSNVTRLLQMIGERVAIGDWPGALSQSSRAVQILKASRDRDSGSNMAGPLAFAQLNHGLLLGANGEVGEAMSSIEFASGALSRIAASNPQFVDMAALANAVRAELAQSAATPPTAVFRQVSMELNQQF